VYCIHFSTATWCENLLLLILLSQKRILGQPILDRTILFDHYQLCDLLLTVSDKPIQIVKDDHVMDRAVQRWMEPKYLTYSTFAARARLFFNWPQQPPRPSPDSLSRAGFFYTGKCNINFLADFCIFAPSVTYKKLEINTETTLRHRDGCMYIYISTS
jgi:hypothetical protein